ncbi:synaptotagmin-4-like isoform X2 [Cornus florida]|uniref:synaptotagmin-4-like isoform X2 n=1 Tax=Cornus florida TaxID=4283 RepID=UPI00289F20E0|nr:synaptotagmin-4-like isoform X2 [Cornus florida]
MGLFLGLFFGIAFSIGLMTCFAQLQKNRSQRRSHLATTVISFSRMTVEDSKKILPPDCYPPWVVFLQQQKLNWLNVQLEKIWPYVNEAASQLIRTYVEPILEQYRPVIISSLKFSKLTLGTVAPQFTGVSVIEGDTRGVTMELELQWDGNPSITIDVKTKVGVVLPIKVKNIQFTGVFSLIFKPLVDVFPCFGAVSYSLKEKKNLDFQLKVVGSDISTIPGISDAIEEMIQDAIEDSITWPVRRIIPILPGNYSDLELKPVGTLEVKLVQAKDLLNKDIIGKSDPYAVLFIRPLRDKMKTSKTINNELNPIWNEHFEFVVEDAFSQHLTVRVFDDEGVQASELVGYAQVLLKDLEPGKVKDMWLKLVKGSEFHMDKKYRGQVLKAGMIESKDYDILKSQKQMRRDAILRGVLSLTVMCAEDLPAVDLMGKADPYVVLTMKKSKQRNRTRVANHSLNPVWDQTFHFVVEDALHDMLILEVWDHDILGKDMIGKCIMTLTRVLLEGEFTDTFDLDGTESGKLHLHLKWTPQPILRDY